MVVVERSCVLSTESFLQSCLYPVLFLVPLILLSIVEERHFFFSISYKLFFVTMMYSTSLTFFFFLFVFFL